MELGVHGKTGVIADMEFRNGHESANAHLQLMVEKIVRVNIVQQSRRIHYAISMYI